MIGSKLANRYEILLELGRGGMGVVYLASDPLLEREVAIKFLPTSSLNAENEARFRREARVVAKMDHPAIVSAYDIGEHEGSLFLVMPFIQGSTLRSLIEERALRLNDVLDISIQIAEALDYSHSLGIIHRDIKPENVMVTRDESDTMRVRVMDFGLAVTRTEDRLTRSGTIIGTVSYLSPEQVIGEELDERTDIYSLGTLIYECLVGKTPFNGEVQSVLYRIVNGKPPLPQSLGIKLDSELEAIVMQCLEKHPDKRPYSARMLADSLIRYRAQLREGKREQIVAETVRWNDSHRRTAANYRITAGGDSFIGRDKELVELQWRLNAAIQGQCQLVLVSGEAGIGKSRLLEELERSARAKSIPVLHGRFFEQDRSFPYQAFCDLILEHCRHHSLKTDFSDLAPDLMALFPALSELEAFRSRLTTVNKTVVTGETRRCEDRTFIFELLARAIARIADGRPLVLLLEHLHCADVSVEALQYIVRRLGPAPLLFVCTFRSSEADRRHPLMRLIDSFSGDTRFELIKLSPFSPLEHSLFVESIAGELKLEKDYVDRLYAAAEGNPFFVKELLRSIMESDRQLKSASEGLIPDLGSSSELMPETINQVVEKRIERLPEETREILVIASVLGKSFHFSDLKLLMGDRSDLEGEIDRLISGGFLEEERESRDDRLSFASAVLRDSLYTHLSRRRRRALHRKYAEELEARNKNRLERVYYQLVYHYSHADVPEKVVEYGMKCAQKALDALSTDDCARAVKTVLEFLDEESESDRILEGEARQLLASALRAAGDSEGALKEMDAVIKLFQRVGARERLLQAIDLAAEIAWEGRKMEEALRCVEKGVNLAQALGMDAKLKKLCELGATLTNLRGDYQRAQEYLAEAARLNVDSDAAEEAQLRGGTITVGITANISARSPHEIRLAEEAEILPNVFETLLATDARGNLVPLLCERWEVEEGGCAFVFTIRPQLTLHDGTPLGAQTVKASMERAVMKARASLPPAFSAIKGVGEYLRGECKEVSGISALGARLRVELQEPLPIYPSLLTDVRTAIAVTSSEGEAIVGSGPFQFASYNDAVVILSRNENYWRAGMPLVDKIEFLTAEDSAQMAAWLKSGRVDIGRDLSPQELEELLRDRRLHAGLVEAPKKNLYFALFNTNSPICSIPVVRQALSGIVRVHDLVRGALGRLAQPAEGLVPPGLLGHDSGRRHQPCTKEKAQELLRASTLELPITLRVAVHPVLRERYGALAKALFDGWRQLGVNVVMEHNSSRTYVERQQNSEGIDLIIGRWIADYDDPDSLAYGLFHSEHGRLRAYYCGVELDQVIEQARSEIRLPARERLYRKFENILLENKIILPLYHNVDYRVVVPRVRRLNLRGSPPYVNYAEIARRAEATTTRVNNGQIHVPIQGMIDSLDPALVNTTLQAQITPTVFETLFCQFEGTIKPWLAEGYVAEEGGRRYRIRLRENIRFHDGRLVTARDVRYSLERMLRHQHSDGRWFYAPIQGAPALLAGSGEELTGFHILSQHEFVLALDKPISFFPALLAYYAAAIVPEGTQRFDGNWRQGCVGTGPFRVIRYEAGAQIELEANPYYWRTGYPRSEGLTFTLGVAPDEIAAGLRSGRFSLAWDLYPADVIAIRHEPEFKFLEKPHLSTYLLAFNTRAGIMANETVRHRVISAIDVGRLVQRGIGKLGLPAIGLIPPGLLGAEQDRLKVTSLTQQVTTALAGMGLPKKSSSVDLRCAINVAYRGPYAAFTSELFEVMRHAGFSVHMLNQSMEEYYRLLEHPEDIDIVLSRWVGDYPDADTFAHGLLHSTGGRLGRICGNEELDRMIELAREESEPAERHRLYRSMEEMIRRHAILLPLFHDKAYRFARPEIEGFELNFFSPVVAYEKLSIKK